MLVKIMKDIQICKKNAQSGIVMLRKKWNMASKQWTVAAESGSIQTVSHTSFAEQIEHVRVQFLQATY